MLSMIFQSGMLTLDLDLVKAGLCLGGFALELVIAWAAVELGSGAELELDTTLDDLLLVKAGVQGVGGLGFVTTTGVLKIEGCNTELELVTD